MHAENGAERGVLEALANAILFGKQIDPFFQKVANAIVMKAVVAGKLPPKKKGRPNSELAGSPGWDIAARYFSLVDSGKSYDESVTEVAKEFHKDERTIMRYVKDNKIFIGDDANKRKYYRDRAIENKQVEITYHPLSDPEEIDLAKSFSIEKANEFINDVLNTGNPTDTK